MAFPLTVSASVSSCEIPGRYGTFYNGANRYQILITTIAGNAFLSAFKSTDGGSTWAEMDAGNRPQAFAQDVGFPPAYTCTFKTTTIYVATLADIHTAQLVSFSMASDTWGTVPGTTALPVSASQFQVNGFMCLEYRAASNTLVLVMPGNLVQVDGVGHFIASFVPYDLTGSSWGSWSDLDYLDYSDINEWNMLPVGTCVDSDGRIVVLLQQISRISDTSPVDQSISATGDYTVPADCIRLDNVQMWGAGSGSSVGAGPSAGGGAGAFSQINSFAVTPNDTLPAVVGLGGAPSVSGGDTSFVGALAKGGTVGGSQSVPGTGGSAASGTGDVKHSGGNGGTPVTGGGGGGASATALADGGNGANAVTITGGAGGAGEGDGGAGGNTTLDGDPGQSPGGAGGGAGASVVTPTTGAGQDGVINFSYLPQRGTQAGRLFAQVIKANDSLGALTSIPAGTFPIQALNSASIPFSIDVKAGTGFIVIALSGVNASSGNSGILLGKANNSDTPSFTLQLISVNNGGSQIDPSPAVAIDTATGDFYCVYKVVSTRPLATFYYIGNVGGSLGVAVSIGSASAADCRITANYNAGIDLQFGTPTKAAVSYFDVG